jgi:hypothetical protein
MVDVVNAIHVVEYSATHSCGQGTVITFKPNLVRAFNHTSFAAVSSPISEVAKDKVKIASQSSLTVPAFTFVQMSVEKSPDLMRPGQLSPIMVTMVLSQRASLVNSNLSLLWLLSAAPVGHLDFGMS